MDKKEDKVEKVLDLIAEIFPDTAEKMSTIAFVNWHNILNHSALEDLENEEVLFVANLIFALASNNYISSAQNIHSLANEIQSVSFDEAIEFLNDESDDEFDDESSNNKQ